ncbi:MAG: 50S ribosomal protein L22 [Thaumarchaeota archaeon]|nr:50S ribosomal protein L22 [Nitrososphaerota archaeon]
MSPKAAREVCTAIKGKLLPEAKTNLEKESEMKEALPLRRYNKEVAHRRQLQGFHSGGYPVKAVREVLAILNNLEANAGFKGMNTDRLRIIHALAHRGMKIRNFTPRAQGRSTPLYNILTHVELVAKET